MILRESRKFPVKQPLQQKPRTHGTPRTTATELRKVLTCHLSCLDWQFDPISVGFSVGDPTWLTTNNWLRATTMPYLLVLHQRLLPLLRPKLFGDGRKAHFKLFGTTTMRPVTRATRSRLGQQAVLLTAPAVTHSIRLSWPPSILRHPRFKTKPGRTCRLISAHAAVIPSSLSTAPTR